MLVPWLVLAAPLAGMCLRMTLAQAREIAQEDYVRTAVAKGLSPAGSCAATSAARRSARRSPSHPSRCRCSSPMSCWSSGSSRSPGFFYYVWAAIGHNSENAINLPIVIAAALWMTVLLIVLALVADAIVARLDPRVHGAF